MADQETKDAIESTALTVVQEQQNIVGGAMVGAAGSAMAIEPVERTTELLDRLVEINMLALRKLDSIIGTLRESLGFDKDALRRQREDATELAKERAGDLEGADGKGQDVPPDPEAKKQGGMLTGALAKIGGFLLAIPGVGFIVKLFAPIMKFFGKGGTLVKVFGRFGPLGVLITGFLLLRHYADDIAKALAPALDKLKELIPKLQPVIDFFKRVGDFLIKTLLTEIGNALELVVDAVTGVVEGFKMIFEGDILGGLNRMFGLEEGLLGFLLDLPKKIFDKTVEFLGGLAEAMGIDFKALYDNIALYVTDTITNIKNFFIDLKNNIVGFFVDAYNTVKTTITDAVQGAFNFIADIFNSISDFMSSAYTKAKNFVTSLPDKILGFISNMFSPIIDFFNAIGNRIKSTINGVIDALPLPGFVKDKIKFDVEPTQDELDNAEKEFETLEAPSTNEIKTPEYNVVDGVLQNTNDDGPAVFKKMNLAKKVAQIMETNTGTPYEAINTTKGFMVVDPDSPTLPENLKPPAELELAKSPNIDANEVDIENAGGAEITVVNNNYNTNNSSVANQTDVHSGALDTGIDTYHDKLATATS